VSQLLQVSTIFPPRMRSTVIPSTDAFLPVGAIVPSAPRWVPVPVQRVATHSPSVMVRDLVEEIRELVSPHSRKWVEARSKARSLAIMEAAVNGDTVQPSDSELNSLLRKAARGERWDRLFPGVAKLRMDTNGDGISYTIRITKAEGIPIRLVKESEEASGVVAVRRVNELSYYSLGLKDVAQRVGLSAPRTLAVIYHLGLQGDDEYFKQLTIGSARFKRYSNKAVQNIREQLPDLDMGDVWAQWKARTRST
jgi:hypothetical protein